MAKFGVSFKFASRSVQIGLQFTPDAPNELETQCLED